MSVTDQATQAAEKQAGQAAAKAAINPATWPAIGMGCGGCLLGILAIAIVALGFFALSHPGSATDDSSYNNLTVRPGETKEFVLTHYTPCTPGYKKEHPGCDASMEGDSSTANGGRATYDKRSPMGFYITYKKHKYYFAGAVAWQDTDPVLPFVYPGKMPKMGVFFDNQSEVFVAMDHFGGCANNPKAIDILASNEKYNTFINNLRKAGLDTGKTELNGCSTARKPVFKGTMAEIISIAGGGTGKTK